jgi:hypothetical protein
MSVIAGLVWLLLNVAVDLSVPSWAT